MRPERRVFLVKQLVKLSSYPGADYDHVALVPLLKLLVRLYLGALVHLSLQGSLKPVSPVPAIVSPQAGFFFKYKEVLSGAYLSVQTCSKVLGDGTFCTCWLLCERGLWWT